MSTLDQLIAARALIAEPGTWTTGCASRDATGLPVPTHHPDAVCFCAWGAVERVRGPDGPYTMTPFERLAEAVGLTGWGKIQQLFDWNDASDQPTVLAVYDRAIALERKRVGG